MSQTRPITPGPPEQTGSSAKPFTRGSVVRATVWTLGGEASSHILRIVSSLILTRLLFPEDFGIMAVVQVFMQGLNMFSDLGIRPIIIRHERGDEPEFLNTIWTVRLVRGAVLALMFCAIAWPVAKFYDRSVLAAILPVASLNLFLEGFLSTKTFSHERRMARGRLTLINLTSSIAGIVFMIVWAWLYRSVWALVWGGVFSTLVRVLLSHVALPGPGNRFHWDPATWREVAHFGKWIFLNSVVTFLAMQMDKLVFAKLIPLDMLGFYAIAINVAQLPIAAIRAVATSVVFPALSRARDQIEDLARAFDRTRLLVLLGGGAGFSFLIFNGPWVMALLYDPRYEMAGTILQVAAIGGWFVVLETSHGFMLLTLGHPRWLTVAGAVKIAAWMAAVIPAFHFSGFPGALLAASAIEGVRYVIESAKVRTLGLSRGGLEGPATFLVLGGGAAAMALQHGTWGEGKPILRAMIALTAFAALWLPAGLWGWRKMKRLA